MKIRAVIDTNVLVSGIISFQSQKLSPPAAILKSLYQRKFVFVLSGPILKEVRDVLLRPHICRNYRLSVNDIRQILISLRKIGFIVRGDKKLSVIKEDPADNMFLATAIEGKADYIVSGDRHLSKLREFKRIPIVTARKFMDLVGRHPPAELPFSRPK